MKIFTIEGVWDELGIMTVNPILNLLTQNYGTITSKFTFRNFDEFKRYISYITDEDIIYITTHGRSNNLKNGMSEDTISLDQLVDIIGCKAKNRFLHLSACSVLNISDDDLYKIKDKTQCKYLSGYSDDVYWLEGASMDLIYFDYIMEHGINSENDLVAFRERYGCMIRNTGFKII
jgi:hypothetical protein